MSPNPRLLARILFLILAILKNLSRAWAVLLIIAATFLVYWPALRNGFVWDDTALVLRDPLIRSWILIPEGFRHFLFLDATASNFYRPIQRLSFVADYQFFGFANPGGWHFTSILAHAGAAVGLFFVAEKILATAAPTRFGERTRRIWALAIAALWAIHPLHTSAVTYIAGRADLLSALFGFAALALGLASLEKPKRVWWWRGGATAGLGLALLSKESGVTFLLIWLLVLIWRRPDRGVFARWAVLMVAIVGGYCALRFTAEKTPPPPPPPTPVAIRPILAARAFAEYTSLLLAPVELRMERDVSTKPRETYDATLHNARLREYQTLGGVLLILGFIGWGRFTWRRAPSAAFCLGAFILAYLPISNVFSLNATVAEHWLYVPSAFLILAIALTCLAFAQPASAETVRPGRPWRLLLAGVTLAWVIALGVRTFIRQGDWRDQRTFIERTIAAGGDSPRMLMNLANVELGAGQSAKATELYREALRRSPDQPVIWLGYANVLTRAGDLSGAREALTHAESSPMLRAECLQLRATWAAHDGSDDPLRLLREAVAVQPAGWPIRKRYLDFLINQGDFDRAQSDLVAFLKEYSYRADSWKLLGQILEKKADRTSASIAYREAARRDMRDLESRAAQLRVAGAGSDAGNR